MEWHGSVSEDVKKNPTIPGIVEELRLEQSRTESNITILDMGNLSRHIQRMTNKVLLLMTERIYIFSRII